MVRMKLQQAGVRIERFLLRIGLTLLLLIGICLVGKRAIGDWYFRKGSPESIQAAIRWDGNNPQYCDAWGTLTSFYMISAKFDESVTSFECATRLSPYNAHFWSDLGGAYDRAGRPDDALRAFQRALQLFPLSPEINWRFANFAFRSHRIPETLRALPLVLAGNNPSHRDVFRLALRATPDKDEILEKLPHQALVFFEFLNFEMEAGDISGAEAAWRRILQLNLPFDPRLAFPYLDALIQHHESDRLVATWSALAERFPAEIGALAKPPNLVENGSFEHDLLDGGLDWRVVPVEGAVVSLDSGDAFERARALRIEFSGKANLDYGQVFQYVPVQPNRRYLFSGAIRVKGITTDSGPRFQVFDALDMRNLFLSTEGSVGSSGWSVQKLEFKTSPATRLLIVRVARIPSQKLDNLINGTAWIDQVRLTAED